MSIPATAIRERLGQLGWTVMHVGGPGLTIDGRDMSVISAQVKRDELRGVFVVLLASKDGDRTDRFAPLSGEGTPSRRILESGWKIRAQVYDREGARAELAYLRESPQRDFEDVVKRVEQRGWQIDRKRSKETFVDQPSWSIRGARGRDLLEIEMVFSANSGPDEIAMGEFNFVCWTAKHMNAFATVIASSHAEELVSTF